MRHIIKKTCPGRMAGHLACGLPAGSPAQRAGIIIAEPANQEELAGKAPRRPLCRLAKRGAEGAGQTVVTDYRIAGPGRATRNPVGWGEPQTPLASPSEGATA